MMDYTVIGQSFRDIPETEMEEFYQAQLDTFYATFPDNVPCVIVYDSGRFTVTETHDIPLDYIDTLPIKDGVDFVRFENGSAGFVAYDSGFVNGFEIVTDPDTVAEYSERDYWDY